MGSFKFNGKSTRDLGIVIQTPPSHTYPERDVSSVHVPGRIGDLYIDNNTWKQSDRSYLIAKEINRNESFVDEAAKIVEWLESSKGKYCRLEDSYDPEVYRLAVYISGGGFTNYYDEALSGTISFKCKPQRYLKIGEEPITYSGTSEGLYSEITNITKYESKPIITINGLDIDVGYITMLEILDANDQDNLIPISNISFMQSANSDSIIIDSENMTVIGKDLVNGEMIEKDISAYINNNGKEFPKFVGGKSAIRLEKYQISSEIDSKYPSYKNVIDKYVSDNNGYLKTLYKPQDAIIKEKQKSIFVKSYEQLLMSIQESYNASSVQAYAMEKCDSFTFSSFSSFLDSICSVISVGKDDIPSGSSSISFDDYGFSLSISGDTLTLRSLVNGYFRVNKIDKNIRFYSTGSTIGTMKSTDITSVYCYKTRSKVSSTDPSSWPNYVLDVDSYLSVIPYWLDFKLIYSDETSSKLSNIEFWLDVTKDSGLEDNPNGPSYYWFPKKWIWEKDSWIKKSSNEKLESMKWDGDKGGFVKSLSTDIHLELTYYRIKNVPVYEDIVATKEDEDGNKKRVVESVCHFEVSDTSSSSNMGTIKIKAKNGDNGWYKCDVNDEMGTWKHIDTTSEASNARDIADISGTDSFVICYIADHTPETDESEYTRIDATHIPTYFYPSSKDKDGKDVEGWPDWLDPQIYDATGNKYQSLASLTFSGNNITKIYFKPSGQASSHSNHYYRYSFYDENEELTYSNWILYGQGPVIKDSEYKHNVLDSFEIGFIDRDPDDFKYKYNRCYTIDDQEENVSDDLSDLDIEWLDVEFQGETQEEELPIDKTPNKIIYKAASDGLYKWDTNDSWEYKHAGDLLLETEGKDQPVFYYMSQLPDYFYGDDETVTRYLTAQIIEDKKGDDPYGNPTRVIFKASESGYFRINSESNWKWFNEGDQVCESYINLENEIRFLIYEQSSFSGVTIVVVPRWWML